MITGREVVDFIRNCKLEDKIICRGDSDALMFIVKDEWDSNSKKSDIEFIGINKQTGRYFKSKTVNETYIAYQIRKGETE